MRQLSDELLECARRRLSTEASKKLEGELRRATSDLYFAMFHAVCGGVVEPIGTGTETTAFRELFQSLYRMADHGRIERHAREVAAPASGFSDPLRQFARQLSAMKNKREQADYDPLAKINLSTVRNDLQSIESLVKAYWDEDPTKRAQFAMFLALRRS